MERKIDGKVVTIKNVKTFYSREWGPNGGYHCDVYLDGKKAYFFHEAGDGGCPTVNAYAKEGRKMVVRGFASPAHSAALEEMIPSLMDEHENNKRLKRQCKTKTLYRLSSDDPDQYWAMKVKFGPEVAARLREKHGDKLVEIINERF